MVRLVPTAFSREFPKLDEEGRPTEEVIRISYELIDVTEEEYNAALKKMLPFILPVPWRDKPTT